MVDLLQVECFDAVLRTGSFRAAAIEVNLAQPSVSAHIGKLERELGLRLFDRGPAGTRLTAAGEQMVSHLRAFAASEGAIRRATAHIHQHVEQSLTVLSYRTGLINILPPAFRTLDASFDPMRTRMIEAPRAAMVAGLIDGSCDVALDAPVGDVTDPGIDTGVLIDLGEPALIGRPGHRLFDREDWVDLADIGDEPLVIQANLEPFVLPLLPDRARRRVTVANDSSVVLALLDAGAELGIAGLGRRIVHDPTIARRPIIGSPHVRLVVMTAAGTPLSPPAVALRDYLVSWGQFQRSQYVPDPERGLQPIQTEE